MATDTNIFDRGLLEKLLGDYAVPEALWVGSLSAWGPSAMLRAYKAWWQMQMMQDFQHNYGLLSLPAKSTIEEADEPIYVSAVVSR